MNLLLVGSGNLGSRYLQGLASLSHPISLTVSDPSEDAIQVAKNRLKQVHGGSIHSIKFNTCLENISEELDLALIVTPSHCRASVVRKVAKNNNVKAWVLEKVLAQSSQQIDQIEDILKDNSRTWVNTPRRLMSWHQTIKSQILPVKKVPLRVKVSGGSWDLACNTIHFIDLVAWWTKATVVSVNANGLGEWIQSKRAGFSEVLGDLLVSYDDGSVLELSCHEGFKPLQIVVFTPQGEWIIEEYKGVASGPNCLSITGEISFQSKLTAPLVVDIVQNGNCALPTLSESIGHHRPFINALLNHWNSTHTSQLTSVPIT